MRRVALLLALTATVAASPAAAAMWRLAGRGGEAPTRSQFFVDVDSIHRDGDDMTLVTLSLFETTTASRDFDKSVITRRANCARMTSQIIRGEYYAQGKLLQTDTSSGNVLTLQPDSVMYAVLQAACGKGEYLGAPVTTPQAYWGTSAPSPAPTASPVPYRYGGH